jgi:para-aminobenzoate synthetase component I
VRHTAVFPIEDLVFWKKKLLHWAADHAWAAYLDSNESHFRAAAGRPAVGSDWECLVGAGAAATLESDAGQAFERLQDFQNQTQDWLFGGFSYDLKNEVERLHSGHFEGIGLPDLFFFQPEIVVGIRGGALEIYALSSAPEAIFEAIKTTETAPAAPAAQIQMRPRMPRAEYLRTVEAIRQHIVEGDVYEMNLCQEFFAEQAALYPVAVFERLNALARAPFATFLRCRERYLLSASPERFLKKTGATLLSQPIKGTRRRAPQADESLRAELAASEKDRAENVMIVDLVRNDLARNCLPGSVEVPELFGIYTFETVHQMISTVRGTLRADAPALRALRDAFPPGSMTGAPKVMAMRLIERYERTRRGLYAGAVGFFDPAGDFDFNVVIRSILYNAAARYASVQVGGAIVFDSVPEREYEECLTKAEAMLRALGARLDSL